MVGNYQAQDYVHIEKHPIKLMAFIWYLAAIAY